MRVTVAIPTYNRASLLRQTLEGVVRQDLPPSDWEILVIDNNSSDQTEDVVASFARLHPALRRVVERQQGLNPARNRAIAEASGEVIVFGDDDILVERDWVRRLTEPILRGVEGIGAAGGEVVPVFPDGCPDWIAGWHGPLAFRSDSGPIFEPAVPMGANLAFPKAIFREVGLFQSNLDRAGDRYLSGGDREMIRRIRRAGYSVWFVPEAAVRHQMPASRTTLRYAARHAFDSARSRVAERAAEPGAGKYLASRFLLNAMKAAGFGLGALGWMILFQSGRAKQALVRSWRSCGYLAAIIQSCRRSGGGPADSAATS